MFLVNDNIFLTKDYSDEDFADLSSKTERGLGKTIIINREIALNPTVIDKICKYFNGTSIRVSIPIGNVADSTIFNEEESQILQSNFEKLKQNNFSALFVEGSDISSYSGYTLEDTMTASRIISEWANSINSATVYGRPLSPLEKYLYAYSLVTKFKYEKGDDSSTDSRMDSRNLVKVLTKNKIVCIGYASMLSELCKQIGIPCLVQLASDSTNESDGYSVINHAKCKVFIDDFYYDYHAMVNSDPSRDAFKDGFGQTICHAIMTDKDIDVLFDGKVKLAGEHWFYSESINMFMDMIHGYNQEDASERINMSSAHFEIEKLLIDVFSANAINMESERNSTTPTITHDDLEQIYFPSIYDELYRYALQPQNKYSIKRLEKIIISAYKHSNISMDDLFAEILDYGNRYQPDKDMLEEFVEMVEDERARQNFIEIKRLSAEADGIDPLLLFEAMSVIVYLQLKNEDKAIQKTSEIFDNSSKLALNKWSFKKKSDNFFQEEAQRLEYLLTSQMV